MMKQRLKESDVLKLFFEAYFGKKDGRELQKFMDQSGWDSLTNCLAENGLLGVAYEGVKQGNISLQLPAEVSRLWKNRAMKIAVTNILYEQQAGIAFAALNSAGLKYILLKGFAGMEKIYGSLYIRAIYDIDILVEAEAFQTAKNTLESVGFVAKTRLEFSHLSGESLLAAESNFHEIDLVKHEGDIDYTIDLHWHTNRYLAGSPVTRLFPEQLIPWLDQVEEIQLAGTAVRCMTLENQFLFMVWHYILHHMLSGSKWLMDICQFLNASGNELDWKWIATQVTNDNLIKLIAIALYLHADLTGRQDVIGTAVANGLPVKKTGRLELYLYRHIPFLKTSLIKRYAVFLLLPRSLGDRLTILRYILFDPSAAIEGRDPNRQRNPLQNLLHIFNRLMNS